MEKYGVTITEVPLSDREVARRAQWYLVSGPLPSIVDQSGCSRCGKGSHPSEICDWCILKEHRRRTAWFRDRFSPEKVLSMLAQIEVMKCCGNCGLYDSRLCPLGSEGTASGTLDCWEKEQTND